MFSSFLLTKLHWDSRLGKPSFCTSNLLLTLSPANSLHFKPFCHIGMAPVSLCRCKGLRFAASCWRWYRVLGVVFKPRC